MTSIVTTPTGGPQFPPEFGAESEIRLRWCGRVFGLSLRGAGLLVLLIMGGAGLFRFFRNSDALADAGLRFLTTQAWEPDSHNFAIAAVLLLTALIAAGRMAWMTYPVPPRSSEFPIRGR